MFKAQDSLITQYRALGKSYYNIDIKADDLLGQRERNQNQKKCREFIGKHLIVGGKGNVLKMPWLDEFERSEKHTHTVSLYLLGLAFENVFSNFLKADLERYISKLSWYDYKYTWFLACLYHDAASNIERQTIPPNPSEQQKCLSYYLGSANICYTPFEHKLLKFRNQNASVKINRLSEDLIRNYFYFRASCDECDHGILGGYYHFDRLNKNYLENTKNGQSTDKLLRRPEHVDHFAYISDAIICHNIWTVRAFDLSELSEDEKRENEITQERYRQYGLSPLILKKKGDRLALEKYPLQFILFLIDTLEPLKRFMEKGGTPNITEKDVLSSISVILEPSLSNPAKQMIIIKWGAEVIGWNGFRKWKDGIISTKDWLAVETKEVSDNRIEIMF